MSSRLLALVASAAISTASAAWAQPPASEALPPAPAATETPTPAPAPAPAAESKIPAPPTGKGQIVFFRPTRFMGAAVPYKLSDAGAVLGKVSNGKYLVVTVDPGLHTFVMDFGTKGDIRLEIEPDETYYLECGIAMGALLNHPNLIPSSREEFEKFAIKGKPQKK